MPRPIRIEYENAFYHIMNRGRGGQNIFHNSKYFSSFLDCLSEANKKFGAVVHAYCLMTNHYHLILETPNANLSRVMRHINGVYTQRYNRIKKTDGPLFRGRFKAILIDEDAYLLNLNRYIHRNPIKLVKKLEDYKWSSYQNYLDLSLTPKWLEKSKTLKMLNENGGIRGYKFYTENCEKDNFTDDFYNKKNLPAIIGCDNFKKNLHKKPKILNNKVADQVKINLNKNTAAEALIEMVAKVFKVKKEVILNRQIGRAKNNFPRKLAMYLCQNYASETLTQIQKEFNLKNSGSVSKAIFCVKKEIANGGYCKEMKIIKEIYG